MTEASGSKGKPTPRSAPGDPSEQPGRTEGEPYSGTRTDRDGTARGCARARHDGVAPSPAPTPNLSLTSWIRKVSRWNRSSVRRRGRPGRCRCGDRAGQRRARLATVSVLSGGRSFRTVAQTRHPPDGARADRGGIRSADQCTPRATECRPDDRARHGGSSGRHRRAECRRTHRGAGSPSPRRTSRRARGTSVWPPSASTPLSRGPRRVDAAGTSASSIGNGAGGSATRISTEPGRRARRGELAQR